MKIGMLWLDTSPDKQQARVERAATYYEDKYGKRPNLAYVPLSGEEAQYGELTVKTTRQVLPGHIWIGVDNER